MNGVVEFDVIAESAAIARRHAGRTARTVSAVGYETEVAEPQPRGRRGRAWVCRVTARKLPDPGVEWLKNEGKGEA